MQGAKQSAPVSAGTSTQILEWLEELHQTLLMISPDLEITWVSDSLQQVFFPNALNPGDAFDTLFASREQATHVIQTLRERRCLTSELVTLQGQAAGTFPACLDIVTFDNDQGEPSYVVIVRSIEEQERSDRFQDKAQTFR